jgi:hypothetical protein
MAVDADIGTPGEVCFLEETEVFEETEGDDD